MAGAISTARFQLRLTLRLTPRLWLQFYHLRGLGCLKSQSVEHQPLSILLGENFLLAHPVDLTRLLTATQNRFQDKPEIYKKFLEIIHAWQRERYPPRKRSLAGHKPFSHGPRLGRGLQTFLPESTA